MLAEECAQSDGQAGTFKDQSEGQHNVIPAWISDLHRIQDMKHALIRRYSSAHTEDENRHDQIPEVQFLAVSERVIWIRRPLASAQAYQHQYLISNIDRR